MLLAFLRLVTRPDVLVRPLDLESALAYVDEWVTLPAARLVTPTESHWGVLRGLLADAGGPAT